MLLSVYCLGPGCLFDRVSRSRPLVTECRFSLPMSPLIRSESHAASTVPVCTLPWAKQTLPDGSHEHSHSLRANDVGGNFLLQEGRQANENDYMLQCHRLESWRTTKGQVCILSSWPQMMPARMLDRMLDREDRHLTEQDRDAHVSVRVARSQWQL